MVKENSRLLKVLGKEWFKKMGRDDNKGSRYGRECQEKTCLGRGTGGINGVR